MILLERESKQPLYLQIVNTLVQEISKGTLISGLKLPGARKMSEQLGVNRRTVGMAYEELELQGWIEVKPKVGCFVHPKIPLLKPKELGTGLPRIMAENPIGFDLPKQPYFPTKKIKSLDFKPLYTLDDGFPDTRIAPLATLGKNINFLMGNQSGAGLMTYRQFYCGDIRLREELVKYLAETRSIRVSVENILITRGSLMAFYLLFRTILLPNDAVIVCEPGFQEGFEAIKLAGGKVIKVPVDSDGMNVDAVEEICKKQKIRAVFVVSHHQFPTTVSLSANRRIKLLELAEKYRFAIVEDDYDYDFHYASSPILPIASSDYAGVVAYVGSFSKTIAPSLRVGFLVASKELVEQISYLSRFVDSYGNTVLERAIAMLFDAGEVRRHLKKAIKVYRKRRDIFCQLLQQQLNEFIEFDIPEGGLAVWVQFNENIPVGKVETEARKLGLKLPSSEIFSTEENKPNAIRIGFASMKEAEMLEPVQLLRKAIENSKSQV
jgi:GntR family transcriptional regulator/MocR family aminotransferase